MNHPGQRMFTMCAPVILESENKVFALGSGGSSRIASAMIQVIGNIIDEQPISTAVSTSRLHPYCINNSLHEVLMEPFSTSKLSRIRTRKPKCKSICL